MTPFMIQFGDTLQSIAAKEVAKGVPTEQIAQAFSVAFADLMLDSTITLLPFIPKEQHHEALLAAFNKYYENEVSPYTRRPFNLDDSGLITVDRETQQAEYLNCSINFGELMARVGCADHDNIPGDTYLYNEDVLQQLFGHMRTAANLEDAVEALTELKKVRFNSSKLYTNRQVREEFNRTLPEQHRAAVQAKIAA